MNNRPSIQPFSKAAADFVWAGGIEDTFVPQTRPGHRTLDEYELMGHYEHWRVDLARCREIGLQALRWGVPWYKVEPEPGKFDWTWTDRVLEHMVVDLKIEPMLDLMHYGCPFWLKGSFTDRDYPARVADFAAAFSERYKTLVKWYTPLNEPIITALMCGMRALWPPYRRGEKGYISVMMNLAKGIFRTVKAIKEIQPEAMMFHVEATGLTRTAQEDLSSLAREETHRGYLCFDLLTGGISHNHVLFSWLLRNGVSRDELLMLERDKIELDAVGMNFYPQWSTKQIYLDKKGRIAFRETDPEGTGFAELIRDYYDRYKAPIMITETSAVGSDDIRLRWLRSSVASIKTFRSEGVPVIGYTWFPIFTMIDWRYRFGNEPLEKFYLELGMYRLNTTKKGERWLKTPLVSEFRQYIDSPEAAIGSIGDRT